MRKYLILLFCLLTTAIAVVSCANLGTPDGGRYDETPPSVVKSMPAQGATNQTRQKIDILFDEYVKITNANEKVIISPPQLEAANVRADGKHIKITLYDSLKVNTTYTVDFSDAIEDNNEGNPMGNYTFSFSTGDKIDTMEVAGTVLNAENLEPIKGILVGLYPLDSTFCDSTFIKEPLCRVSRTNGSGRFSIKGVANGKYRAFALQDADGNFCFSQKSEMLAFDTLDISTWCKPDLRYDTVWHDSIHYDSIRVVPYIHYYPDDVVLKAFLEEGQAHYFLKSERQIPDWFRLYFTAPADTLPMIKGLNFDEKCLIPETNPTNDTITYWVRDTAFTHNNDTIAFSMTYLETDSAGALVPRTDTLELIPKTTYSKIKKEMEEKSATWEKERAKLARRSKKPLPAEENPFTSVFLEVKMKPTGSLDPNKNISITANEPISRVDSTMIHLYHKQDSDWLPEPFLFLPDEKDAKSYILYAEWQPKERYMFLMDSLAITGIMGHQSRSLKSEFSVRSTDDYGSLFIHVIHPDTGVVVQLLNKSDKPIYQQRADKDGQADFFYLKPGEYYVRAFVDKNGNNKWDTGEYISGLHPEETFYFPKPMQVRAKWDVEQDWELRGIPADKQKPMAITKQKPDRTKDAKQRNKERDEEKRRAKEGRSD